jgi:hypothetical protein
MNRLLSVLLIAAAASLFLAATPETSVSSSVPVNLRIEIAPTYRGPYELLREQHPDTYTCSAMLLDEAGKRIDGYVDLVLRPGQELTRTTNSHGLAMTMKGRVDAERTGAVAEVTVVRAGTLIARQESRMNLKRPGRTPVF